MVAIKSQNLVGNEIPRFHAVFTNENLENIRTKYSQLKLAFETGTKIRAQFRTKLEQN